MVFGWVTALGVVLLFWDFLTIGSRETRTVKVVHDPGADLPPASAAQPAG
jgi:hypothetical protein